MIGNTREQSGSWLSILGIATVPNFVGKLMHRARAINAYVIPNSVLLVYPGFLTIGGGISKFQHPKRGINDIVEELLKEPSL